MPEFILNHGSVEGSRTFNSLDEFTQGYIEAMFFTEEEPSATDENWNPEICNSFPGSCSFQDLAPEALDRIKADCAKFQTENESLLNDAYELARETPYDAAAAGRDFWFTRNGHGVGYWDRRLGEIGNRLSAACKRWREVWVEYGDDQRIYVR